MRRNEDIALDMMKFIAVTTGYGKTGSPEAGGDGDEFHHVEGDIFVAARTHGGGRKLIHVDASKIAIRPTSCKEILAAPEAS
jgi:hypothetical protein